jgi:hypothetical protein
LPAKRVAFPVHFLTDSAHLVLVLGWGSIDRCGGLVEAHELDLVNGDELPIV